VLGGVLPDLEDVGDPPWRYPSLVVLVVLGVFFPWWSFGDVVVVLEGIVK
jgi:hypothetical protein